MRATTISTMPPICCTAASTSRHGSARRWATAAIAVLCVSAGLAACGTDETSEPLLALGSEATVEYTSMASGDTPAVDTTIGVTVLAVRSGGTTDLTDAGYDLDAQDADATPTYVDVRYSNLGSGAALRSLPIGMEDTNGRSIPSTILITLGGGAFSPCPDDDGGTLDPGDSYESCTVFLVPAGTDIASIRFVSQGPDATITFTDWSAR